MKYGGYADNIAWIDLTNGTVEYKGIPEEYARKYIGGRGLGVRYMLDADPTCDPLAPDNRLCFMNGPLTGTRINMSGRMAVVTKSPLTGTVTDSHHGGWSAARLRWAGFDGFIIEGASDRPVYLYIEDGEVSIEDASEVWGKDVHETVKFFQDKYDEEKNLSVITIGPAGEKLVKFANWMNEDDRASGRGGTGAVGGSKKLKAIVIKAERNYPDPADYDAFKDAHSAALGKLTEEDSFTEPRKGGLSVYGTNILTNITSGMGAYPTRNAQTTSFGDEAEFISAEYVNEHYLINNPTCHACPVACKKEVEVEYQGQKLVMESFEYESAWALGGFSGNSNGPSVAWMIDKCNKLGVDTIEMGTTLACYMEVHEQGWDGQYALGWGDHEKMVELIEMTAKREGIGDVLAEGTARVAAHYGHPEVAMAVRGQGIPAYDPRGLKGMGLGYATSNRGACHLRGYSPASELGVIGLKTDPLDWESKPELLKLLQDLSAFTDSLDLCKFSQFVEEVDTYVDQYVSVVGVEGFDGDELLRTGERIYNAERYFNMLAGEEAGADTLPPRFTEVPSTEKGSEGEVCELDLMLEEYYKLRGWENGLVPDAKLQELEVL